MSAEANRIVNKLWSYCNVLRDDGLSYGDYLEQLTYLLFLKMADEQTKPPWRRPSPVPAGYRPATNEPGHHQTMIQSLPLTLGIGNDVWVVLDALRRQRNANDYTGQPIPPATVAECATQAKALNQALLAHLRARHPDLLAAQA